MGGQDADALLALIKAVTGSGSLWVTSLFIVGAALLLAHRFGLLAFLSSGRTSVQSEGFQDRLLKALEASHAREDALQAKLTEAAARNDALRDEIQEARLEVHMMRQQLRLFLRALQQVKAGLISIDSLPLPDWLGGVE